MLSAEDQTPCPCQQTAQAGTLWPSSVSTDTSLCQPGEEEEEEVRHVSVDCLEEEENEEEERNSYGEPRKAFFPSLI